MTYKKRSVSMRRSQVKRKSQVNFFKKHLTAEKISAFIALLFISIVASSFITTIILKNKLVGNKQELVGSESMYTESGSPLDKRQIADGTNSLLTSEVIFHGPRDKKQIALTFDAEMTDGMKESYLSGKVKSSYDKRIIDILNSTQTKATLFLTGMWTQLYPAEAKSFAQNPLFEIESHSYADTSFDGECFGLKQIRDTQDLQDIETAQKIISDTTGVTPIYFRFPGGCYSLTDLNVVIKTAGLQVVHWDVVGADGFNTNTSLIEKNVIDNVQNGSIIVLHMNGAPTAPKTAEALPEIIRALKEKGFEFVKVSELLAN